MTEIPVKKKAIITVKPTRLWRDAEQRWYKINDDGSLTPEKPEGEING